MLNPRPLTAVVFLCLGGPGLTAPAQAQVRASSVFVEQLTTQEVSAALRAGKTTVLIPVGGTEQKRPAHGHW